MKEGNRSGLAPSIVLACSNCAAEEQMTLCPKIPGGSFAINRLAVFGMRLIGRGRQALVKFCAASNMPTPMSRHTFVGHQSALLNAAEDVAERSMNAASSAVKSVAGENVVVSADGTWMRRGFSSLYDAMSVIAWDIGQVVDAFVASRFCSICSNTAKYMLEVCSACSKKATKRRAGTLTAEVFETWKAAHQPFCSANYPGSAPAMESAAAVILWLRSMERRGLRYPEYIGDGDCKGHASVVASQPYGPDVTVNKSECVGHIQKRLGHRLRELVKKHGSTKLSDGKSISGKGRLTGHLIDSLQNWYGRAIRDNAGDYRAMAKAIWASVCHRASTDDEPRHDFCPDDSWCQYRKATPEQPYKHHDAIPKPAFVLLLPIYRDLADKPLLLRCEKGATQNRNECFNKLVWSYIPKTEFSGAGVVNTAVCLGVIHFNHGMSTFEHVLLAITCLVLLVNVPAPPSINWTRLVLRIARPSALLMQKQGGKG